MKSFKESLERLGMERIDILHIHDPANDYDRALTGAFRALDQLRSRRAIGAVGVGMNQAEMLTRFAKDADIDCILLAGRYTLLDQSGLHECFHSAMPKASQSSLAVHLTAAFLPTLALGHNYNYRPASNDIVETALRFTDICTRHKVSLKSAALQFPFGHQAVTSVLVGCRSRAELEENIAAFETEIPVELWRELKAVRLLPDRVPTP